jgi:hypothetical protein
LSVSMTVVMSVRHLGRDKLQGNTIVMCFAFFQTHVNSILEG